VPVTVAPAEVAVAAVSCSFVARVSTTGAPGAASSSATIAVHCSAVLPGA
jgi:hypothetical protein